MVSVLLWQGSLMCNGGDLEKSVVLDRLLHARGGTFFYFLGSFIRARDSLAFYINMCRIANGSVTFSLPRLYSVGHIDISNLLIVSCKKIYIRVSGKCVP